MEREPRPSVSIPMISVTHAENEDDDYPLSQQKNKATDARAAVESVQNVLEENIAGIDECEWPKLPAGSMAGAKGKLTAGPPSLKSRRRGRPLEPWYRKKVSMSAQWRADTSGSSSESRASSLPLRSSCWLW